MNLFALEPEKYYSFPSAYTTEMKKKKVQEIIDGRGYVFSLKTDGNWARFVSQDGEVKLQSRGISKKTGVLGELQDRVVFVSYLSKLFPQTTVLIGEIYLDNGKDKDVGAILRCLPKKALERQQVSPLKFRIFDVYYLNGRNLLGSTMLERIEALKEVKAMIAHPLINVVNYFEADDTLYDKLEIIFKAGGEGIVLTKKTAIPAPGSRTAWKTLKLKQELDDPIDCFIYGVDPPTRISNTTQLESWEFWEDVKTGEKVREQKFYDYAANKGTWEPITKNYFYGWCGAIRCAVFDDNGEPFVLCSCSGLTEEFKDELKNNYTKYHMMPIKITGMMMTDKTSIRHPKLISLREGDIDVKDCTLKKVLG